MNVDEFRKLNGLPPRSATSSKTEDAAPSAQKRGTQPQIRLPKLGDDMNKTEAAWKRILESNNPGATILYEPFTLRLPSGTRYTPDFVVVYRNVFEVWEVKGGHIHSAASLRAFKEARAAFPFWNFRFAQKRGTEWTTA